jgi:predicted TIM-barrel fold metal-dependent hydrolase
MDTTRAIMSLLSTNTTVTYPEIKFIFSHAGGATTSVVGRIAGSGTTYLGDGGITRPDAPAAGARLKELQKFYYDTAGAANPVTLGALRKMVPLSQILFGTDFPFTNSAEQLQLLKDSQVFTNAELEAIFSENTARLLPRL